MKVHLITNCTNLKKSNIQGKITLESLIKKYNSQSIVSAWFERLENAEQKVPANEVYAGDHGKVASSISIPDLCFEFEHMVALFIVHRTLVLMMRRFQKEVKTQ